MKSDAKKRAEIREEAAKQEAKKQQAKRQETKKPRSIELQPCLYCGKPTRCPDYIINPEAAHELPCCSEECFDKTKKFVDYDTHKRKIFYFVLFILVVTNLILLGFEVMTRWRYIPLLGIGIAACVYPLIFTRYERYQKFGIRKTMIIIRIFAAVIAAFALLLIISY